MARSFRTDPDLAPPSRRELQRRLALKRRRARRARNGRLAALEVRARHQRGRAP